MRKAHFDDNLKDEDANDLNNLNDLNELDDPLKALEKDGLDEENPEGTNEGAPIKKDDIGDGLEDDDTDSLERIREKEFKEDNYGHGEDENY